MEKSWPFRGAMLLLIILILVGKSRSSLDTRTRKDVEGLPRLRNDPLQINMGVDEIIRHSQYPAEQHSVVTEDGYILTVHRIPRGKHLKDGKKRPVVFLQHGVMYSSAAWVITGENSSLAFILADSGYDVWMGNLRGNIYSKEHTNPSVDEDEFMNYSWHEMAKYDLPAMIDYVLDETSAEKLFYIGHSTGANVFFIMCALRPEYNSKIEAQFSLAPDTILDKPSTTQHTFGRFIHTIGGLLISISDFGALKIIRQKLSQVKSLCDDVFTGTMCKGVLYLLGGTHVDVYDQNTMAWIIANFPTGTSKKTVLHYGQCVDNAKYAEYNPSFLDYIFLKQHPPKEYNLTLVQAPVYIHYSLDDVLSSEMEARILHDIFPNAQGIIQVNEENFNHLDFLWGRNVKKVLYDKILRLIAHRLRLQINQRTAGSGGQSNKDFREFIN